MSADGTMFIPNCIKIRHLVHKLPAKAYTHMTGLWTKVYIPLQIQQECPETENKLVNIRNNLFTWIMKINLTGFSMLFPQL
jgi:hypothetical protein